MIHVNFRILPKLGPEGVEAPLDAMAKQTLLVKDGCFAFAQRVIKENKNPTLSNEQRLIHYFQCNRLLEHIHREYFESLSIKEKNRLVEAQSLLEGQVTSVIKKNGGLPFAQKAIRESNDPTLCFPFAKRVVEENKKTSLSDEERLTNLFQCDQLLQHTQVKTPELSEMQSNIQAQIRRIVRQNGCLPFARKALTEGENPDLSDKQRLFRYFECEQTLEKIRHIYSEIFFDCPMEEIELQDAQNLLQAAIRTASTHEENIEIDQQAKQILAVEDGPLQFAVDQIERSREIKREATDPNWICLLCKETLKHIRARYADSLDRRRLFSLAAAQEFVRSELMEPESARSLKSPLSSVGNVASSKLLHMSLLLHREVDLEEYRVATLLVKMTLPNTEPAPAAPPKFTLDQMAKELLSMKRGLLQFTKDSIEHWKKPEFTDKKRFSNARHIDDILEHIQNNPEIFHLTDEQLAQLPEAQRLLKAEEIDQIARILIEGNELLSYTAQKIVESRHVDKEEWLKGCRVHIEVLNHIQTRYAPVLNYPTLAELATAQEWIHRRYEQLQS